ncbi:checkpoint clamp complex protein Rad1 [Cladophialophora chaetospira]|uniref:Checkpoint clamp complex protein Rad1 n=1 Tax=Cladophialophora chaetospira TaxID=386627 RepID=A0AA38XN77_9EURO|nr:checkpoint clamp complex protein Rad1 [Cladophialophora chaetospira]
MVGPPIFTAVSTSARQLYLLLRCIAFSPRAEVEITQQGIKFSVEESRAVQGSTILEKALFSSYSCRPPNSNDNALPAFSISITALLETLQIFGVADTGSSARNPYGGFSSSYGNAFSTPALALSGTCRISYQEIGAPLTITIQEGSVTTSCELNTYEVQQPYDDGGGIPLDRSKLCLRAILRSTWLSDAIAELSGTNPNVLVVNVSNRSAPYFSLEGEGGPFGDTTVDFTPDAKNDATSDGVKGKKQPVVTETFVVSAPSGTHGRVKQRYKFDMIKKASRAMALATKVSVRQDEQGVLSLQFMVELGDGTFGPRREETPATNAPPAQTRNDFVDFRFVPLLNEDDTESEAQTEDEDFEE